MVTFLLRFVEEGASQVMGGDVGILLRRKEIQVHRPLGGKQLGI